MKVWSALDGEAASAMQFEIDDTPEQPFVDSVAAQHRAIVGRALWSDSVGPYHYHYALRLHEPSEDDGWLPFANVISGAITTEEVQALLAHLPVEEAERLEVSLEPNRGGDGLFGFALQAGQVFGTLLSIAGAVETLRLAAIFRALSRLNHGVPMDAVAAFRRTGALDDELRWWLRQDYTQHFDSIVALTGLTSMETRSALEAAGFRHVEPSGAHWARESRDDDDYSLEQ